MKHICGSLELAPTWIWQFLSGWMCVCGGGGKLGVSLQGWNQSPQLKLTHNSTEAIIARKYSGAVFREWDGVA